METPEIIETNIRLVLKTFENFHKLLEHNNAFSRVSKEEVKDFLKLAIFIEKAIVNFQEKNCVDRFINIFKSLNEDSERTRLYSVDFYGRACDHVLSKLFIQKSLKPAIIDVALRMYTTLLPKERLENMLTDFIVTSASCSSILDYTIANKNTIDIDEVQAHIMLQKWAYQMDVGKSNELYGTLNNMLSTYKIRTSLPFLVKILVVEYTSEKENKTKQLILDMLLKRMSDRSILSKAFWLSLFKDTSRQDLAKVCSVNQEFLLNLSRFIVYLGSMMVKLEDVWCGDSKLSICPEITFNEILMLVRSLKDYSDSLKRYLCKVFRDADSNTSLLIWEEFTKNYIHEFL